MIDLLSLKDYDKPNIYKVWKVGRIMEFIGKVQEKIYQTINGITIGKLQVIDKIEDVKYSEKEKQIASLKRNQAIYTPNKEEFNNLWEILKKYNHGQIFKLGEIPEVFRDKIVKEAGGLEKNKLKEERYISLVSCLHVSGPGGNGAPWSVLTEYLREGGFHYVDKKEGGPGLKLYKRFWTRGHSYIK